MSNAVPNRTVAERLLKQGVIGPELDERIRHDSARWTDVGTVFEMLPNPSNRVTPSDRKDALGIPMLRVNYDVDDYVKAGKVIAKQDYARFAKLFNAEVVEDESGWQNRDHIMGTVIMGSDPKDSVVNGDCRTHDHDNLFLATTGVVPASGVINPTLTGVALAIRIADTINKEI
jgi:choline dehydrogenase-like flavoprotein